MASIKRTNKYIYIDIHENNESLDDIIEKPEMHQQVEMQSTYDIEMLIHHLTPKEVELMVLKYLGLETDEIADFMSFKKRSQVYSLNSKLKKSVKDFMQL